jgi:hypothetical protein
VAADTFSPKSPNTHKHPNRSDNLFSKPLTFIASSPYRYNYAANDLVSLDSTDPLAIRQGKHLVSIDNVGLTSCPQKFWVQWSFSSMPQRFEEVAILQPLAMPDIVPAANK